MFICLFAYGLRRATQKFLADCGVTISRSTEYLKAFPIVFRFPKRIVQPDHRLIPCVAKTRQIWQAVISTTTY